MKLRGMRCSRRRSFESRFEVLDKALETRKNERNIILNEESKAGTGVIEAPENVLEHSGDVMSRRKKWFVLVADHLKGHCER